MKIVGATNMNENVIYGINGPVVTVKESRSFSMMEMVYVGNEHLVGEIIGITDRLTTIQVYEETTGLKPGEPVIGTGSPMNVTLGPGIIDNIFDGIERPLKAIREQSGAFISRGSNVSSLDEERLWDVTVLAKPGDTLKGGDIYAECPETSIIKHKCMVPPLLSGIVTKVSENGSYHVNDTIVTIEDKEGMEHSLTLCQRWPIRTPRPVQKRQPSAVPLITGQRVIDTLFPISKGGTAAIPGGFGTGKTMTQHQLAKWCDADIIVYVGCGERGNEMSQVLDEFSELIDPKSGRPMTDRTVLIANTSNMPVAAREASIYTGITLAEYYRDMGYHVAIMADSTSRWAEALREISGRLEEMPAEEGFPAYLPSRLSEFYERAGMVDTLNGQEGSITIIGAVSPQGSDFSEPVTQNTKRFTRCFWALDKSLAYARHYPAINWTQSYSEYFTDLDPWYTEHLGTDFVKYRRRINNILQEESQLMEIVKLIGSDVLPDDQKLIIEIARVIRVGFLQQNAFHPEDTYVPLEKQKLMMKVILHLYKKAHQLVAAAVPISGIIESGLFDKLVKMKYDIPNDKPELFDDYIREIDNTLSQIVTA
jgi:V/A-type H+-transporting ATPase subunit A